MENVLTERNKLSIITINKNNANGLKKTIDSVINQTSKNFQYIVIDGASTDNSSEVIKSHEDRIDYWVSEPDSGIYNAMNKGIKEATGEYCLFLNSGDYLLNENVIGEIINDDISTDIAAYRLVSVGKSHSFICSPPKEVSLFTFTRGSLLHPSTFIRRNLFARYGYYDENYKILSDWKFFIEALILNNCSYSSRDNIISVFDSTSGLSSLYIATEKEQAYDLLKKYFPRIMPDYFLDQIIEYEYMQNCYSVLSKTKLRFLIMKYFLKFLNFILKGRNKNEHLISTERIR